MNNLYKMHTFSVHFYLYFSNKKKNKKNYV